MNCKQLLLFGATGDLAGRYLLPALASLHAADQLPAGFTLTGAARQDWSDEQFRRHSRERLDRHAASVPAASRDALISSLRYLRADSSSAQDVAHCVRASTAADRGPLVAYLALPAQLFAGTIAALRDAGLPAASRIAIEKPFGVDLDSARALNRLLAGVARDVGEHAGYRIDFVLGLDTVQNLLPLRMLNPPLAALWNASHIEQVEILWEETLAMEGRGSFYDATGAVRDVMQNHMMMALCELTMEAPSDMNERELRDRKVELLRAVRPPPASEMATRTCRARYTAGRISAAEREARAIPAYVDEPGVDGTRGTETFARFALDIDNGRWRGTRFVLRAGKALERTRKEAVIHFRAPAGQVPLQRGSVDVGASTLRIGLDGPKDIALQLHGLAPDAAGQTIPVHLTAPPLPSALPAYARVLLDLMSGGSMLSVRGDLAEESWRIVMPILDAWAEGRVPLLDYPAGSRGP
jgi:glucose-6-phosphate 1-dehydrogenase